uniref:ABC transporter domain-containing protein n=1 Tax=Chromera velia CCMP2878 TaxID=1169474 RepID=A0A0G4GG24_9ALVE|eukprot:Cvel_21728.t1-p1 / transcript=Cvel_21728.t1 / gene=Cvel_21728 / organism=Chromera_velia_CCMP2878 / gene_product=Multidrug resistance protein 3, putative / transcript_product=Multidrug resistance protein 3, putative / location=Cvel_scaffold2062:23003-32252(-) / protein_length=993 / sequence_SO=supercontig / SO=protein_coding / is_pseudo=false
MMKVVLPLYVWTVCCGLCRCEVQYVTAFAQPSQLRRRASSSRTGRSALFAAPAVRTADTPVSAATAEREKEGGGLWGAVKSYWQEHQSIVHGARWSRKPKSPLQGDSVAVARVVRELKQLVDYPLVVPAVLISLTLSAAAFVRPTLLGQVYDIVTQAVIPLGSAKTQEARDEITKRGLVQIVPLLWTFSVLRLYEFCGNFVVGVLFALSKWRLLSKTRLRLFGSILQQETSFHDRTSVGSLSSRIQEDCTKMQGLLNETLRSVLTAVIETVGGCAMMLWSHTSMGIFALVGTPVLLVLTHSLGKIISYYGIAQNDAMADANDVVTESLSNVRVVQAYGGQEREYSRYAKVTRRYLRQLLFQGTDILLLAFGMVMVLRGTLTVGRYIAFRTYMRRFYEGLDKVLQAGVDVQTAVRTCKRYFELVDRIPEIGPFGGLTPSSCEGVIEFEDVWFSYPGTGGGGGRKVEGVSRSSSVSGEEGGGSSVASASSHRDLGGGGSHSHAGEAAKGGASGVLPSSSSHRCGATDDEDLDGETRQPHQCKLLGGVCECNLEDEICMSLCLSESNTERERERKQRDEGALWQLWESSSSSSSSSRTWNSASSQQHHQGGGHTHSLAVGEGGNSTLSGTVHLSEELKASSHRPPSLSLNSSSYSLSSWFRGTSRGVKKTKGESGREGGPLIDEGGGLDESAAVLRGISFKARPSQMIALVGPSGSGKSTVAKLIQRLYEPQQGTIRLDGTDIRDLSPHWLRQQIGVVEQEPQLFNRTVFENIAYGLPSLPPSLHDEGRELDGLPSRVLRHSDDETELLVPVGGNSSFGDPGGGGGGMKGEGGSSDSLWGGLGAEEVKRRVEAAARIANAHEFIKRLPQGYDSVCGGRGTQLSGGQKQRVAIARAVIGQPRIIIFDEATSSLDSESEAAVQKALEELREGRTTIVIAHRLSTIRGADLILVLDEGVVVEGGTHRELVARGEREETAGAVKYLSFIKHQQDFAEAPS